MVRRSGKEINRGVSHAIKKPKKKPAPKARKTSKTPTTTPSKPENESGTPTIPGTPEKGSAEKKSPAGEVKSTKSTGRKKRLPLTKQEKLLKGAKVFSFEGSPKRSPAKAKRMEEGGPNTSGSTVKTPEKTTKKRFFGKSSPRKVTVNLSNNILLKTNTRAAGKIESRSRLKSPLSDLRVLKPTRTTPSSDTASVSSVTSGGSPRGLTPQRSPRKSPRKSTLGGPLSAPGAIKRKLGLDDAESGGPSKMPRVVLEKIDTNDVPPDQNDNADVDTTDDPPLQAGDENVFPIFNKQTWNRKTDGRASPKSPKKTYARPRSKSRPSRNDNLVQLQIDAGQKDLAAITCEKCLMVYIPGDEEDYQQHEMYHESRMNNLNCKPWKTENVAWQDEVEASRISCIDSKSPAHAWKKVALVMQVLDRELGITVEVTKNPKTKAFLYIRKNIVEGAVIAEEIAEAHRAVPPKNEKEPFCCTEESFPAKCGINRIWTCEQRRRNGIASLLVDQVRAKFVPGMALKKSDVAFSDPTPSGIAFATKYCGVQDFLMYRPTSTN